MITEIFVLLYDVISFFNIGYKNNYFSLPMKAYMTKRQMDLLIEKNVFNVLISTKRDTASATLRRPLS